jgi:peptidoglycan/xylan/chitin deacetylase (PgdA/CDA1 family)
MTDLWTNNHPSRFWLLQSNLPEDLWQEAIQLAIPELGLPLLVDDIENALSQTLGEGQFGSGHFHLSLSKRLYYQFKPLLPRPLINLLKSTNARKANNNSLLRWPIEDRFVQFQWEVLNQLKKSYEGNGISHKPLWPDEYQFAFVLTHDIETSEGQSFVRDLANLEEEFGFRSSFNFVPERYDLDFHLMQELRQRDFEIGIHGLKHDGKLFRSKTEFTERAHKINQYLKEFDAVGFRAPLMHRNPYWMQALEIEYDLSFFDTDPYEPIPGGCMSIWPFFIGHFVELPYTLVQDSTLGLVLGENTPRIWMEKVAFIEQYRGMALLNSHPDYLSQPDIWNIYVKFLMEMKEKNNFWHALPREVARWWLKRNN